jgi:signal transduction histidine kinase
MKLQGKFALYNAVIKIVIILLIGILMPVLISKVVLNHIDRQLTDKKEKFIHNLSRNEIAGVTDSLYSSYNILKEEFIQLSAIPNEKYRENRELFIQEDRVIENETAPFRILQYEFSYEGHPYLLEIGNSMSEIRELNETIRYFTILGLVVILFITAIFDIAFTRFLLRPFYKIIDLRLKTAGSPEEFNFDKIPTDTADFRQLDESIRELMTRISDQFRNQKQFTANVSHELLTPISIVYSRIENILLLNELDEALSDKLHGSLKVLNRLKKMVNSLLLISKIENEQYHKNDLIRLRKLVTAVLEETEDRRQEKKIRVDLQLQQDIHVVANESLLHTLFFNLINNAIKYNRQEGTIRISDQTDEQGYSISVADTGIGMDAGELERIFRRFEKLDTRREDSFGLGLTIAQSIAGFHHIRMEVSSEPGKGSVFRLYFPAEGLSRP